MLLSLETSTHLSAVTPHLCVTAGLECFQHLLAKQQAHCCLWMSLFIAHLLLLCLSRTGQSVSQYQCGSACETRAQRKRLKSGSKPRNNRYPVTSQVLPVDLSSWLVLQLCHLRLESGWVSANTSVVMSRHKTQGAYSRHHCHLKWVAGGSS